MRAITSALLATALISSAAFAEELQPIQAQPISLEDVTGSAYYVAKPEAYELVATLAAGETATPIRFSSTLTPGQVVTISVPGEVGYSWRADGIQAPGRSSFRNYFEETRSRGVTTQRVQHFLTKSESKAALLADRHLPADACQSCTRK